MNHKIKMLCVWSGAAYCVLWGAGLVVTGWAIPLNAAYDANAVAAIVRDNQLRILLGAAMMTCFCVFYLPWTVLLSHLIQSVEAPSNLLSRIQMISGLMASLTFFIPPYMWAAAAYRPLRNPETTQALIDVGWLIFITGIGPFILQYAALAVAIFSDKRQQPVFPRWAGFMQVWMSLCFVPAVMPFFLKQGPFAWNGIFVWWIPLTLFSAYFVLMIMLARKAVLREGA